MASYSVSVNGVWFPATEWSCIRKVQSKVDSEYVPAVNRFIRQYWKSVFYFLRARDVHFADAQDLTQEFFWWFLERDRAGRANSARGRFRDYLRTLLIHFLSDQGVRARRQVQFERTFVSVHDLMGEAERSFEPAVGDSPEAIFDQQWAARLWETVHEQLQEHYTREQREHWYSIFMAYHAPEEKRPSQEVLGARFGLSRDQVRVIVDKVKKRLERLLRSELREEGIREEDVAAEVQVLSRGLGL